MAPNQWEFPESLAVIISRAAWLIVYGQSAVIDAGDGETHDFRELAAMHDEIMRRFLVESVEALSNQAYTLRVAHPSVLERYHFPAAEDLLLMVRCRFGRAPDWPVGVELEPDDILYVLSAQAGQVQAVVVQRLT